MVSDVVFKANNWKVQVCFISLISLCIGMRRKPVMASVIFPTAKSEAINSIVPDSIQRFKCLLKINIFSQRKNIVFCSVSGTVTYKSKIVIHNEQRSHHFRYLI